MKRIHFVLLATIVLLAGYLRISGIGTNPPAISWDEASIGYNAYSILKSGKDEHGKFLPLDTFAAFGDYKPPLAVYLTVPFIAVFGLNETAVRLPSAVFGTITVLMLYLVVLELFDRSKFARQTALLSALVLAGTPWHIMLSRAGFEANIAVFFLLAGIWLVLRARKQPKLLMVCWLPFVAGVYTFNSARYAGPLIAFGAAIFIWKSFVKNLRYMVIGAVIAALMLLPITPHLLSKESRLRFSEVSIFTNLDIVLTANARAAYDGNTLWAHIFDNRRLGYFHAYLVHFLDNLQPRFLFMTGDGNPKFSIQDTGELLLVTAPFVAYGFLRLFLDSPASFWLLLWWLVASIIPAAVARETPHALRIENGLPVYMIATGYGMAAAIAAVRGNTVRRLIQAGIAVLMFLNVLYFWHNMTAHYPQEYSEQWQYGYKQAIAYADSVSASYDSVVLSESIGRPYIYVLFYDRVDPETYRKEKNASFDAAGFYNVYGFGKYRFGDKTTTGTKGRTLYILSPSRVPKDAHILKTVRALNGQTVLVAFD